MRASWGCGTLGGVERSGRGRVAIVDAVAKKTCIAALASHGDNHLGHQDTTAQKTDKVRHWK